MLESSRLGVGYMQFPLLTAPLSWQGPMHFHYRDSKITIAIIAIWILSLSTSAKYSRTTQIYIICFHIPVKATLPLLPIILASYPVAIAICMYFSLQTLSPFLSNPACFCQNGGDALPKATASVCDLLGYTGQSILHCKHYNHKCSCRF